MMTNFLLIIYVLASAMSPCLYDETGITKRNLFIKYNLYYECNFKTVALF